MRRSFLIIWAFGIVIAPNARPIEALAQIGNGSMQIEVSQTGVVDGQFHVGHELLFVARYDDPDVFATPTSGTFVFGDGYRDDFGNVYEGCSSPQIWALNNVVYAVPGPARPGVIGAVKPTASASHVFNSPGTYVVSVSAFVEHDACGLPGAVDEGETVTASATVVILP